MTRIRLPFIHEYEDRHGKVRRYVRRPGCKRIPLPGAPGSPEFMAAYATAVGDTSAKVEIGSSRTAAGTVSAVIVQWYQSAEFIALKPSTKATYRGIIERFRAEHGDKPIKLLQREHVRRIIAKKAETPAAANNLLRVLRLVMQFAIAENIRADDPTADVKPVRVRSEGFHTWSEEEIAAFEAAHPIGTRARLAFALLLHTAQRRSDVVRMGRQHVRDGNIRVKQAKTGTELEVPLHAALVEAIAGSEVGHLTYLTTGQGKPFSPAGFTNWFRECVKAAGLPDNCAPHGLRKAACRRLAEAGCSAHQIMSISGHKTLKEVERYCREAAQKGLARSAMRAVQTPGGRNGEQTTG